MYCCCCCGTIDGYYDAREQQSGSTGHNYKVLESVLRTWRDDKNKNSRVSSISTKKNIKRKYQLPASASDFKFGNVPNLEPLDTSCSELNSDVE